MTIKVRTPKTHPAESKVRIFLAGSIENGVAENWQERVIDELHNQFEHADGCEIIVNNPRHDDWDSSIDPSIEHPELVKQINWELDELDKADIIVMYFDPNTKSPISLLELGLFKDKNIFVYCDPEFWRSVNVAVTCERFGIPLYSDDVNELMKDVSMNISYVLEQRGC